MFTFEWDPQKAARNLTKHGVSFDEATSVFLERSNNTRITSARKATRREKKIYEEG